MNEILLIVGIGLLFASSTSPLQLGLLLKESAMQSHPVSMPPPGPALTCGAISSTAQEQASNLMCTQQDRGVSWGAKSGAAATSMHWCGE